MIVGVGNYLYARGKRKSTIYHIRPSVHNSMRNRGEVYVGMIMFPAHCIGKRVRVKIEFLDDKNNVLNRVLDKNDRLVEPMIFGGLK